MPTATGCSPRSPPTGSRWEPLARLKGRHWHPTPWVWTPRQRGDAMGQNRGSRRPRGCVAPNQAVSSRWADASAQGLGNTLKAPEVAQLSRLKPGQMAHTGSAGSASILGIPTIPPELFAAPHFLHPTPPFNEGRQRGCDEGIWREATLGCLIASSLQ